jgi:hypothetical protein
MHAVAVTLLLGMMSIEQPTAADAFVQSSMPYRQPPAVAALFSSSPPDDIAIQSSSAGDDPFATVEFQQALEKKNASRQKFGVKPLSPQEFSSLQSQVQQLEQEQLVKRQQQQAAAAAALRPQPKPLANFAKQLFASVTDDTCYSNLDCESPKICCDLGFKKMCCSSGMKILETKHELARIPVYGGSAPQAPKKKY